MKKPRHYWTYERCQEEALKYNTTSDFHKRSRNAYDAAWRKNFLHDICKHMKETRKGNNYWNKERCASEAIKYSNRKSFKLGSPSAYISARLNNWLDEICKHMKTIGNLINRCVYIFIFDDKSVYIGLTYSIEKRIKEHLSYGPVYRHIIKSGLNPNIIQLTDYINFEEAQKIEVEKISEYKANGFNILNTKRGGEIGSYNFKCNYEYCKEKAKEFKYRTEFKFAHPGAYTASLKNGWLSDVCSHMPERKKYYD